MFQIFLSVFLILFGVTLLVATGIPPWAIGVAAVVTGLVDLASSGGWFRK